MKENKIYYQFGYTLRDLKADINAILKKYGISVRFKKHTGFFEQNICRYHERLRSNEYALFKSQIGFNVYYDIKLEIDDDTFTYSSGQVGNYSNNNIFVDLYKFDLDDFENELCEFLGVERIED